VGDGPRLALGNRRQPRRHLLAHAAGVALGHVLGKARDPQAGRPPDAALVRVQLAGDDAQQGRFAGAVATDQGQPLPRLDAQAGALEQREMAEGEGNLVEGQQGHTGQRVTARQATEIRSRDR
jgi:hypothetical protein